MAENKCEFGREACIAKKRLGGNSNGRSLSLLQDLLWYHSSAQHPSQVAMVVPTKVTFEEKRGKLVGGPTGSV